MQSCADMKSIEEIISDRLAGNKPTYEEEQLLNEWLGSSADNRAYYGLLSEIRDQPGLEFGKIERLVAAKKARKRLLRYSAVAAIALLILSGSLCIFSKLNDAGNDVLPSIAHGAPKAILTLSSGETVLLGGCTDKIIVSDDNYNIETDENSLTYSPLDTGGQIKYDKLTIPCGGEYTLKLSDGTRVYLNSLTEIRYPANFSGQTREVYLSGEAYFEVESNPQNPFIVHIGDLSVRVTGTSFNINAYPERQMVTTTLEEGAVQLIDSEHTFEISPGMQATYDKATGHTELAKVNTKYYTCWKDGYFHFDNAELEEIMSTLAMWYDFNVVYLDDMVRVDRFTGRFKRYDDISYLLKRFEETNEVKFSIEENTITVGSK